MYENSVHCCCTHTHEYERLSSCCVRYGNISECMLNHSHISPLGFCNIVVKPPSNTCFVFIISEFVTLSYCCHILYCVWFEHSWKTAHKLSSTLYSVGLRVWWGWNLVLKFFFQWIEFKSVFLSHSEMLEMN